MKALSTGISLSAALILLICPAYAYAAGQEKQNRELEWVKRLTAEFFELALARESKEDYSTSATAFLSPELNAQLKEKSLESSALAKMAWQYQGGTFRLKSAEMAPNGSEVILKGELAPRAERTDPAKAKKEDEEAERAAALVQLLAGIDLGARQDRPADVTIRVAKDSEGGRWLIRFVRVKIRAREKSK